MLVPTVMVNRKLTTLEYPWLPRDLEEGTILFLFFGPTYGCVSYTGIAVTEELNKEPFFEVPNNTVWGIGGKP